MSRRERHSLASLSHSLTRVGTWHLYVMMGDNGLGYDFGQGVLGFSRKTLLDLCLTVAWPSVSPDILRLNSAFVVQTHETTF